MSAVHDEDPVWTTTEISKVMFATTGDQIKYDGIWWEIIERTPVSAMPGGSGTRLVLLHFDEDLVETIALLNDTTILLRSRIWDT